MDKCKTAAQREETLDIIAPFLSSAQVNELCSGRLHAEYRERRRQLQLAAVHRGIEIQRRVIAPQLARSKPREIGGFRWIATFTEEIEYSSKKKYGRGCFGDPDWMKHTLKNTPEARAPKMPCPFVVVQGFRDSRRPDVTDSTAGSDRDAGAANGERGEPATAVIPRIVCP
jgi:hypothetical protein